MEIPSPDPADPVCWNDAIRGNYPSNRIIIPQAYVDMEKAYFRIFLFTKLDALGFPIVDHRGRGSPSSRVTLFGACFIHRRDSASQTQFCGSTINTEQRVAFIIRESITLFTVLKLSSNRHVPRHPRRQKLLAHMGRPWPNANAAMQHLSSILFGENAQRRQGHTQI
jgi:hypothetical protein